VETLSPSLKLWRDQSSFAKAMADGMAEQIGVVIFDIGE
jgi:hypothetical protein